MFLQATVDTHSLEDADRILKKYTLIPFIDYVEIGSPLITHYGTNAVEMFQHFITPAKLYADLKIVDFPVLEAKPYVVKNIRRFSAMAIMNDAAFLQLQAFMKLEGLEIFISTMGYPLGLLVSRVEQLQDMGFDNFIAHGAGISKSGAFFDLTNRMKAMKNIKGINIIAAGGINSISLPLIPKTSSHLSGVIVGRGLLHASFPEKEAELIHNYTSITA